MEKYIVESLDLDWLEMIKEALELGISEDEIRDFLRVHGE
ncbi:DNA-binding anti-repressor SinI [Salinibacillus xinjiangensis]|uniref:DNA-binding anti-repressor SinI n=1 Tax=Salinibacillus xinjiangensis TaxID=1229268 RepID=A0A6G1X264_9BACI|nr:DNA-binding anti-repressor SinI [Salinibacillus xinjiangensis]MRG85032.1 DNA-binding anti-repressor SinI [Salinibacillus xinjiangensis]